MADPVVIATWKFGQTAVRVASELLQQGKPALDAALAGAQAVEDDPKVNSVGYGGLPNALGTVSLDACVMDGKTLDCGAVAAVENIRNVAALARRVMEKTPHVLIVGEGARTFALQEGFPLKHLWTVDSLREWEEQKRRREAQPGLGQGLNPLMPNDVKTEETHDTVTVLALDKSGSMGGVCTTSGLAFKLPGRVGDSPLIGHGLYVDNTAGGAGGTGVGEEIIRIGGSMTIVEAMRAGKTPQQACEFAVKKIIDVALRRGKHVARVAFLALNPKGEFGAAATAQTNFDYAVASGGNVALRKAPEFGPQ
jgi:isoaspartyl peptidase/L-asparaginase-like protein (Ntn-hydrolase superfamily)